MITLTRLHPVFCMQDNKQITTSEPAHKFRLGKYMCFYHGRIKNLHDQSLIWIKKNAKNINGYN